MRRIFAICVLVFLVMVAAGSLAKQIPQRTLSPTTGLPTDKP